MTIKLEYSIETNLFILYLSSNSKSLKCIIDLWISKQICLRTCMRHFEILLRERIFVNPQQLLAEIPEKSDIIDEVTMEQTFGLHTEAI